MMCVVSKIRKKIVMVCFACLLLVGILCVQLASAEIAFANEMQFSDAEKALYCESVFDTALDYGGITQVRLVDLNLDGLPELVIQWQNDEWQIGEGYVVYSIANASVMPVATSGTTHYFGGYSLPGASAYPLFRLVEDKATGERSYLLFTSRNEGVSNDDQIVHIRPDKRFDASINPYDPATLGEAGVALANYHGNDGDDYRDEYLYEPSSASDGWYAYNGYKINGMMVDGSRYTHELDAFFARYALPTEPDNSMMPRFAPPYIVEYDYETGLGSASELFSREAVMAFFDAYQPVSASSKNE